VTAPVAVLPVTEGGRSLLFTIAFLPTPVRQSQWYGFYLRLSVCLSVCFPHDISKTDAARITKSDKEIFQDEFRKPIYFGVIRSKVKVRSQKNISVVDLCSRVSAGFFLFLLLARCRLNET